MCRLQIALPWQQRPNRHGCPVASTHQNRRLRRPKNNRESNPLSYTHTHTHTEGIFVIFISYFSLNRKEIISGVDGTSRRRCFSLSLLFFLFFLFCYFYLLPTFCSFLLFFFFCFLIYSICLAIVSRRLIYGVADVVTIYSTLIYLFMVINLQFLKFDAIYLFILIVND